MAVDPLRVMTSLVACRVAGGPGMALASGWHPMQERWLPVVKKQCRAFEIQMLCWSPCAQNRAVADAGILYTGACLEVE